MKVNPNGQYYPAKVTESSPVHDYTVYRPGIPIRLELAARFMAALLTDTNYGFQDPEDRARIALREADALINEYNKQDNQ